MILDLLGVGRSSCIQNCLASDRSPSTPTACCWPRRTCSACGWRCRARKKCGLDANRVLDLGIYIIIAALVGAKLLLLVVDFDQFRSSPADLLLAGAIRRRVLRRPAPRGGRGVLVHRQAPACRSGRRATCLRRGSRWATSPAGSGAWPPAAATASRPTCRGPSSSRIRWRRPTSARRSASRCTRRSSTRPARSC